MGNWTKKLARKSAAARTKGVLGGVPPKYVCVTRYAESAWERCYPSSNHAQWEACTLPNSVRDYFMRTSVWARENLGANGDSVLRIVTIDDEYFDWVAANGLEDDERTRSKYAAVTSNEDATRLAKKHDLNVDVGAYLLRVTTFSKDLKPIGKTYLKLDDAAKTALEEYLEGIFGEGAVKVPGQVLHPVDARDGGDKLRSMAAAWAKDGVAARYGAWDEQNCAPDANVVNFYVPVYLKTTYDQAEFPFSVKGWGEKGRFLLPDGFEFAAGRPFGSDFVVKETFEGSVASDALARSFMNAGIFSAVIPNDSLTAPESVAVEEDLFAKQFEAAAKEAAAREESAATDA